MFSQGLTHKDASFDFSISDYSCIDDSPYKRQSHSQQNENGATQNCQKDPQSSGNNNGAAESYSAWKSKTRMFVNSAKKCMSPTFENEQFKQRKVDVHNKTVPALSTHTSRHRRDDYETDSEFGSFYSRPDECQDSTTQYLHFVENSLREKYKSSLKQELPKTALTKISSPTIQHSPHENISNARQNNHITNSNASQHGVIRSFQNNQSQQNQMQQMSLDSQLELLHSVTLSPSKQTHNTNAPRIQGYSHQRHQQQLHEAKNTSPIYPAATDVNTSLKNHVPEVNNPQCHLPQVNVHSAPRTQGCVANNDYRSECATAGCACNDVRSCSFMPCDTRQGRNALHFHQSCCHSPHQDYRTHCSNSAIDARYSNRNLDEMQDILQNHTRQLKVLEELAQKILAKLNIDQECQSCRDKQLKSWLHLVNAGTQTMSKEYVSAGVMTSFDEAEEEPEQTIKDSRKQYMNVTSENVSPRQGTPSGMYNRQPAVQAELMAYNSPEFHCSKPCCRDEIVTLNETRASREHNLECQHSSPRCCVKANAHTDVRMACKCCIQNHNTNQQGGGGGDVEKGDDDGNDDDNNDCEQEENPIGWTFYNNVVGETNKLLHAPPQTVANRSPIEEVRRATLENLKKLGINVCESDSSIVLESGPRKVTFDPARYPQMGIIPPEMNPPRTDTSMQINAMAMKYLKDDQLGQLHIASGRDMTVYNVSTPGANMSFATLRYLQRYHLLPHTGLPAGEMTSDPSLQPHVGMENATVDTRDEVPSRILDIPALKKLPKLL